jgi:NADH-quinone oxidoreductase subunit C
MSERLGALAERLRGYFEQKIKHYTIQPTGVVMEVSPADLLSVCAALRDQSQFRFEQLMDLAGIDYLAYGMTEWSTDDSSREGFSRGVDEKTFERFSFHDAPQSETYQGARFAVAYQLLSIEHNVRLCVKAYCEDDDVPVLDSITGIWACADWYEREAFDLYGIIFEGHPDLRRILTDYGFIGHPFRKDFPLVGHVQMRYDEAQQRVIYEPASIEPRVLVPRVIRDDHRYVSQAPSGKESTDA